MGARFIHWTKAGLGDLLCGWASCPLRSRTASTPPVQAVLALTRSCIPPCNHTSCFIDGVHSWHPPLSLLTYSIGQGFSHAVQSTLLSMNNETSHILTSRNLSSSEVMTKAVLSLSTDILISFIEIFSLLPRVF